MNYFRKKAGENENSIINLSRLNSVVKDQDRLSIGFKMFNEDEELTWTYETEDQLNTQYHRLLHALQIKHSK